MTGKADGYVKCTPTSYFELLKELPTGQNVSISERTATQHYWNRSPPEGTGHAEPHSYFFQVDKI